MSLDSDSKQKLKTFVFWGIVFLASVPLVYYYYWPFARDAAVYVRGFEQFLMGSNPYATTVFRSGLIGSSFIYILSLPISGHYESIYFIVLNLLGTILFVKHFLSGQSKKIQLFAMIFCIWCSPSREGLNTIQITGILLGLLYFVLHFFHEENQFHRASVLTILPLVGAVVAIDLKPHFSLPVIAMIVIKRRALLFGVSAFSIWLLGHLLIDLYAETPYTLFWGKLMLGLANKPLTDERPDFTNLWALIPNYPSLGLFGNVLPYLIILALFLYAINKHVSMHKGIFLTLCIPLLSTYSHYYDYLGIVCVTVAYLLISRLVFLTLVYIPIGLIAQNWLSIFGVLLTILFVSLYVLILSLLNHKQRARVLILQLLSALIIYLCINIFKRIIIELGADIASLSATLTLVISSVLFLLSGTYLRKKLIQSPAHGD